MARTAREGPTPEEQAALDGIAESIRGSFQTVEDMTSTFIREAIIRGVFAPGYRLNLETIASTLGVSRMPVRAGLRQLESEGLIRINPYRGATVSVLDAEEIAEIYEMRVLLESYLLERAIPNLDDAAVAELRVIVSDLEDASDRGRQIDRRNDFYGALYSRAGRPRAQATVEQLRGAVGRYLLLQRVDEHPVHDEFCDYLADRDVVRARTWLVDHLQRVSAKLQELVTPGEEVTASKARGRAPAAP